SVPIQCTD
nr:Chain D, TRAF family member-associated NF-kappaB activator [Peptide display vector fth1]5H10_E Chain E, TRAF family member-associated NF-kappaB activator [Peptide display vector fth1]5H10_F Chain F, TRAF family member-associated NF-kappaB activator [Peptide display vector fth1]